MGLDAKVRMLGGYRHTNGTLTAEARIGQGSEPAGVFSVSDGTGAGQANQFYSLDFNIAAGATLTVDLKGGGGEKDVLNAPMAMTAVKSVLIEIGTPAAGTSILFGPQAAANGAQLWFGGVGATDRAEVLERFFNCDSRAGWPLDATHKVLALKNPGAGAVTGKLRVTGTK